MSGTKDSSTMLPSWSTTRYVGIAGLSALRWNLRLSVKALLTAPGNETWLAPCRWDTLLAALNAVRLLNGIW